MSKITLEEHLAALDNPREYAHRYHLTPQYIFDQLYKLIKQDGDLRVKISALKEAIACLGINQPIKLDITGGLTVDLPAILNEAKKKARGVKSAGVKK